MVEGLSPERQCQNPALALGRMPSDREFFNGPLLVRIHIIVMIRWTGLAPEEFEFPFPGSHTSTFLANAVNLPHGGLPAPLIKSGAS